MSEHMTAETIRARVDEMAPRVNEDGSINARHVAIEQTLRERHDVPSYVAELDGPGKFRPPPPVRWFEAHATTAEVLQRGAELPDGEHVEQHLAIVLADAEQVVVLQGSRTRLMAMLEDAVTTMSRMPPQRRDGERRVQIRNEPALPSQAQAPRSPYIGPEQITVVLDDPAGGTLPAP